MAAAVHDANLDLVLVGLANSELIRAGQAEGIRTAQEFFADRNYTDEGLLVSRKLPDAVITDEDFAVARVVRAVKEGAIESASGKLITVKPDTICIHGDNVHARVRRQDPHRADRGRRRGEARVTTATSRNEAAGQWRTEQQPSSQRSAAGRQRTIEQNAKRAGSTRPSFSIPPPPLCRCGSGFSYPTFAGFGCANAYRDGA